MHSSSKTDAHLGGAFRTKVFIKLCIVVNITFLIPIKIYRSLRNLLIGAEFLYDMYSYMSYFIEENNLQ